MKKKIIIALLLSMGIGGITFGGVQVSNVVKNSNERYELLLQDIKEDREAAESELSAARKDLKDIQKKYDKTITKFSKVKEELSELKNEAVDVQEASTAVVTPTPTPEPTPEPTMYTEFDDGKCYMSICGNYEEIGSGRVQIKVAFNDVNAADPYIVNIQGSNGAADNSTWNLTANWDASTSSLIYSGSKTANVNGVVTSYDNITGSLRFDNESTLYWTDPSTGNVDRGPFTKY